MLQSAYFLAKIGAGTAENEQHFDEICRDRDATKQYATGMSVPSIAECFVQISATAA